MNRSRIPRQVCDQKVRAWVDRLDWFSTNRLVALQPKIDVPTFCGYPEFRKSLAMTWTWLQAAFWYTLRDACRAVSLFLFHQLDLAGVYDKEIKDSKWTNDGLYRAYYTWVNFNGFEGATCSFCGTKANILRCGAGWICICGHYNNQCFSGMGPWPHDEPRLGPPHKQLAETVSSCRFWERLGKGTPVFLQARWRRERELAEREWHKSPGYAYVRGRRAMVS